MSETAAHSTYTVARNLRWFAAAYAIIFAAVLGLAAAVALAGVDLPPGLSVGIFAGAVAGAGSRFVNMRPTWTRRDRHYLSLGYLAIAVAIDASIAVVASLFDPSALPDALDALAQGGPVVVVAIICIPLVLFYGLARLLLHWIRGRAARTGGEKT